MVGGWHAADCADLCAVRDRDGDALHRSCGGGGAGHGVAQRALDSGRDEDAVCFVCRRSRGGGWRYNRKIGEDGDAPTGGGFDIAAYNGETFDDGGLHRMSMVADGRTVKLFLDGIPGPEVKFPFSPVVFQFGMLTTEISSVSNTEHQTSDI